MPTSNLAVAPAVLHLVETIPVDQRKRVLDVGPGHGKYSVLLREYLNKPPLVIDAVEAWAPYVDDFKLRNLYDNVIVENVLDLDDETLASYDVILMLDVIEHIEKAAALELLDRIPGRVVVSTPMDFFHNGHGLPPTEDHVSHWQLEDFGTRVEENGSLLGGLIVRLAEKPYQPQAAVPSNIAARR